jgi:hypothetical protein
LSIGAHHHCPDRYFGQQVALFGLLKRKAHEEIISLQHRSLPAHSACRLPIAQFWYIEKSFPSIDVPGDTDYRIDSVNPETGNP